MIDILAFSWQFWLLSSDSDYQNKQNNKMILRRIHTNNGLLQQKFVMSDVFRVLCQKMF